LERRLIGIDGAQAATLAIVQIPGRAWRLSTPKFLEVYRSSERFRTVVNRLHHLILLNAQQSAACDALHGVEARLWRWLLQSQDMTGDETIPLT
jgi:hypothetical protein